MILDIRLAKEKNEPIHFKTIIALDSNVISDRMITDLGDCLAIGKYYLSDDKLVVEASCYLKATISCEVCCTEKEQEFKFDINQTIPLHKTEELAYEVKNGIVDFNKIVSDEFLLSLPSRLLCKETCEL